MTDFENVSELVRKTGASFEEARYAYEACGKDMLTAAEMLEKEYGVKFTFTCSANKEDLPEFILKHAE